MRFVTFLCFRISDINPPRLYYYIPEIVFPFYAFTFPVLSDVRVSRSDGAYNFFFLNKYNVTPRETCMFLISSTCRRITDKTSTSWISMTVCPHSASATVHKMYKSVCMSYSSRNTIDHFLVSIVAHVVFFCVRASKITIKTATRVYRNAIRTFTRVATPIRVNIKSTACLVRVNSVDYNGSTKQKEEICKSRIYT